MLLVENGEGVGVELLDRLESMLRFAFGERLLGFLRGLLTLEIV